MPLETREVGRSVGTRKLFTKDALSCALLLAICLLVIWPIAEIGINDDWSYLLTTQAFVVTHHFIYNGWSTAMLGWQVLWGAFFARLIRPDFVGIRLSTIPIALATAVLYHAILRNFGLNRPHALLGTLTLVLSPLFLALSATFMSDIPGLFVIFLCIYLCQRALAAQDDTHAALWLAAAALTNIGLGTVRQVAWLGVLVIVPCCGWLLRRRRYIVPLTVILWITGGISAKLLVAWFFRHPYSIPLTLFPKSIDATTIAILFRSSVQLVTTSLLFILPVLVTGVAKRWPPSRNRILRIVAVWLIFAMAYTFCKRMGRGDLPDFIWSGNIVTPFGIMQGPELFNSVHRIPRNQLLALFIIVILCTASFLRAISRSRIAHTAATEASGFSWRAVNVLLLPFLACYLLLLFPLALITIFDRYLLVIVAVLLVYSLRLHQERVSQRIPAIATATLVAMAILGVAGTHDLFAMARAEVRLTNELRQAGVPRVEIRGGFDYDTVTQVYTAGYLNDPHLVNPPGAFHRQPLPHVYRDGVYCGDALLPYVPVLKARYAISSDLRSPCFGPTTFAPQTYFTWLPHVRRELFIGSILPDDGHGPRP
jgi:hypothetical protein